MFNTSLHKQTEAKIKYRRISAIFFVSRELLPNDFLKRTRSGYIKQTLIYKIKFVGEGCLLNRFELVTDLNNGLSLYLLL